MGKSQKEWFTEWFDTPYYHQLYKHRNDKEAQEFISTLLFKLELFPGERVLDVACGKGRHSRVFHQKGMSVLGFDLSSKSIEQASIYESPTLEFHKHDMRNPYDNWGQFDAAVNLFTSFGYFDSERDDILSLKNIAKVLKPGGFFVQDYLNGESVLNDLPSKGKKKINGVHYSWIKQFNNGFITKDIDIKDGSEKLQFQEKVKVYSAEELINIHENSGFKVQEVFGNYKLDYFKEQSPRIILISERK